MRFQVPKPLHGWRQFAGEVGIIVLGVLIALAAQQVVERWQTRRDLSEARQALSWEIADSVGEGVERRRIYNCVEHRLDLLAAVVDHAAVSGKLPAMPSPASPPFRTWLNSTWATVSAGTTASNFPRVELNGYANIYVFVDNLQEIARRELTVWSRLDSLAGPGRAFDPREAQSIRNDITEARLLNRLTAVSGLRIEQAAKMTRISFNEKVVQDYAVTPLDKYPMCRAMAGTAPANYGGSAPLTTSLQQARETPLSLPGSR